MKFLLNFLLFITQWLHIKMGGKIQVTKNTIIFEAPKGRHVEVPKWSKILFGDDSP